MTLSYSISKSVFLGNGVSTDFPFAFKVWHQGHIDVRVLDPQGIDSPTIDWTVHIHDTGGTVTYLHKGAPLPLGYRLVILRNMPFTQGVNLITGTRFDPQVIEDALDRATAERQQLLEVLRRAVTVEPGSDTVPAELITDLRAASSKSVAAAVAAAASETAAAASATASAASAAAALASEQAAAGSAAQAAQDVSGAIEIVQAAGTAQVKAINALVSTTPTPNAIPKASVNGDVPLWGGMFKGQIYLASCNITELPAGHYLCNGTRYNTKSSPQGIALKALSTTFKTRWNMTLSGSGASETINVPNLFHADGRGYFLRSVNGSSRLVGSVEQDAVQEMTGSTGLLVEPDAMNNGVFVSSSLGTSMPSAGGLWNLNQVHFAASGSARTATETRALNIGMLPLIYLGV